VAVTSAWEKRRISLPFRVGDLSLVELSFDAAVMTSHYTALSPAMSERYPRDVLERTGTKVAVIHSCPVLGQPARLSRAARGIRYVPSVFPRHTDVTGSFDAYLTSRFGGKTRSTLKRKVRKVPDAGFREYSQPDEVETWHRLAREVSRKTYQERLLQRGLPSFVAISSSWTTNRSRSLAARFVGPS
jgi:hypothetical protein